MSRITQHEQVRRALERLDGIGHLGQIYAETLGSGTVWGTLTPQASIRRIMKTHPNLFHQLKRGLYCLASRRKEFEQQYGEAGQDPPPQASALNHSYYQGLLVEIGNALELGTYVPANDRNRMYLGRRLGEVANLNELPQFGYKNFLRQAKTVDVIWINQRDMPHALIEVEMTTDMNRSLIKLNELRDFSACMSIAAPASRQRVFKDRLSLDTFSTIRKRVSFQDLDKIARDHESALRRQLGTKAHAA